MYLLMINVADHAVMGEAERCFFFFFLLRFMLINNWMLYKMLTSIILREWIKIMMMITEHDSIDRFATPIQHLVLIETKILI